MEPETHTPSAHNSEPSGSAFTVPMAIVVAGALVAGAIYFSNQPSGQVAAVANNTVQKITVNPITENEHYLGNPQAEITFIEFSDTECPYCKRYHPTLHSILDTYGKQGIVAWAYRHFPLVEKHPKAVSEAHALECVAELGGNDAFWKMTDELYEVTPANNGLDLALLPQLARNAGVNVTAFNECQTSGKYNEKIAEHIKDATTSGGGGTPHTVVLFKKPISKKTREAVLTNVTAVFAQIYPGTTLPPDMIKFDESGDKMSFYGEWPQEALISLIETAVPSAKQ